MRAPTVSRAVWAFAVGVAYFASAKLGLSMAFAAEQVTLVWPPTGIALAAVILLGYRIWPAIALGAFAANATASEPWGTAAGIALGNTLEALTAAWLLRRIGFKPSLERFRDVLGLIGFGAIASPIVSATIGVASLCLGGVEPWSRFGLLWSVWWMGDAMGDLVIAAPILTWARWSHRNWTWRRFGEAAALVVALVGVCLFVFTGWRSPVPDEALEYFVFPFIIWAAIRFSQPTTTLVVLVISVIAIWGTLHGHGPFVTGSPNESLFLLLTFLAVVAVTGLTVAAATAERSAVERQVRESHDVLTAITEGTTDAVYVKDREGRYLMINPAGARFLGKTVEEVLGKDDAELFSPDTAHEIMRRDEAILAAGTPKTYEDVGTAAGVTRTYLSTKGPYRDENGNVIGLIGISRDISARKATEKALRHSEERYRSLVLASAQVVFTTDANGEVVEDLPTWRDFTGQTAEEMKGWGWIERVHPDDREEASKAWERAVAARCHHTHEFRVLARDGTYRHVLERAIPILEPGGRVREWIGTCTDITDRKQAEAENARLLQQEKALRADADAANRQKDEFLGMLGHELRNPLAPIRNALEILQQERDRRTLDWALGVIDRQTRHLIRLVDDLLDVSRITRGRIELRKEPADLREIVRQAIEATEPYIAAREHTLDVSMSADSLTLLADATRLEQAFVNLLNNAAKYTEPQGRISVTVDREKQDAVVSIGDSGIGIPPDLLPRVFDLFCQADRTLARSQGGLGIGLTLVQKLVDMHEGEVEARSAGTGRGSEFLVRLPLVLQGSHAVEKTPTVVEEPRKLSLRILLVEDNRDAAQSLATLLELQGHDVRMTYDGPAALEAFSSFDPAVVLLDIGLPGMDGYEVARRIRSRGGSMLLVAMTGYGRDSDRRRSREAGFDDLLVKPVAPEELLKLFASLA